ncbi:MAG: hypothetical protein ACHQUC_02515 [Chlamydiales bacterium]
MVLCTYADNLYSQYWQNEAIKLIENQRWVAGRALGMLKSIALIADIAKNILFGLGNILGYALTKCGFRATFLNPSCSLSNGRNQFRLVILLILDLFNSLIINFFDPTIYRAQIAQFNEEKSKLENQIGGLNRLVSDGVLKQEEVAAKLRCAELSHELGQSQIAEYKAQIAQFEEEKSKLENQIGGLNRLVSDGVLKQDEIAAKLRNAEKAHKGAVDQIAQCKAQLAQFEEEKLKLERQIEELKRLVDDGLLKQEEITAKLRDAEKEVETLRKQLIDPKLPAAVPAPSTSSSFSSSRTEGETSTTIFERDNNHQIFPCSSTTTGVNPVAEEILPQSQAINEPGSALLEPTQAQDVANDQLELGKQCVVDNEYEKAVPLLQAAANQGNAEAKYRLGGLYSLGNGVPKDGAQAALLFEAAVTQGHAEAHFYLGWLYESGDGVLLPKNEARAAELYQEVKKMSDLTFLFGFFNMNRVSWPKGAASLVDWCQIKELEKAAAAGDVEAQFEMAKRYENGDGVPPNRERAIELYGMAAEFGNVDAKITLGMMFLMSKDYYAYQSLTGDIRPRARPYSECCNIVEKIVLETVNSKNANQLVKLGKFYEKNGENLARASRFYRRAEDLGNEEAIAALKRLGH